MLRTYETRFKTGDIVDAMLIGERDYSKDKRTTRFMCKCKVCGREKSMTSTNLRNKHGTTHKACSQGYHKKYPKLYYTWNASVMRIVNPNDRRYSEYGGGGLTHDFLLFIDFVDYMLPSYLEMCKYYNSYDIILDRIDNNKGYIKGNIRWATQKEQANNRRTNTPVIVKYNNNNNNNNNNNKEEKFNSISRCADYLGVSSKTIQRRLRGKGTMIINGKEIEVSVLEQ